MPVGTQLEVELDHAERRAGRVVRVQEAQQGGGMQIAWTGDASPAPKAAEAESTESATQAQKADSAPPSGGGKRGRRRR
jgi:hypothetical protein